MVSGRTIRVLFLSVVLTGLILGAFAAGVGLTLFMTRDRGGGTEAVPEFGVFWEAWRLVENHFYGTMPGGQELAWGAIRGALGTLDDPHTTFLEPQPRQREKEDLSGKFGGIGALVTQSEEGSILLDPMPGLPAERAGILKGDVLVRVDDAEITPQMTVDQVVALIRGEVGSVVRLTLRRLEQADLIVAEVTREEIPSPSVEWRMLDEAPGVGYVRITLFSDRTARELRDALEELDGQGMTGLVLDVRGNGGGLLGAAIDVASEFLADGVVVYQLSRQDREVVETAKRGGRYTEGPLVVLVDGGTASASEIVAGALQDRERATLVGQKTYGKGSVQSVFDLSDGSSVHVTSAEWLTPDRHQITGQGLVPDIEVAIGDEDRAAGRDPQLERAVELLTGTE